MLAKVLGYGLNGLKGFRIDVEVDITNGIPSYETVGLADTAVKESRERVRAAIKNSGYLYPASKITVNLAPAHTKKNAPIYDLAIALGILAATEQVDYKRLQGIVFLGELSLDGNIRGINGILPILISAKEQGINKFFIPSENAAEAEWVEGAEAVAVSSLRQCIDVLEGRTPYTPIEYKKLSQIINSDNSVIDFSLIKGQSRPKRALEIAAAGGHNIIMIGPPGAGKTMLARALPGILPDMTIDEALETSKIHSVAGALQGKGLVTSRPFRTPHHTATAISLIGGGTMAKPGEISLAHNGVLFLDEMTEYPRHTLESLRQPLEDGVITVNRANISAEYPSAFVLVGSMNPCPCGYFGSTAGECKCTPAQIQKYLNKLSSPLLDRIDIHIEVEGVEYDELTEKKSLESSKSVKERVNEARALQQQRYAKWGIHSNGRMTAELVEKFCILDEKAKQLLKDTFNRLKLSARAHSRILKLARTIADLDKAEIITAAHIAEAVQYRSLDRKYWQ